MAIFLVILLGLSLVATVWLFIYDVYHGMVLLRKEPDPMYVFFFGGFVTKKSIES